MKTFKSQLRKTQFQISIQKNRFKNYDFFNTFNDPEVERLWAFNSSAGLGVLDEGVAQGHGGGTFFRGSENTPNPTP